MYIALYISKHWIYISKHKDLQYKQIDINLWQEFHITLMWSLDYQGNSIQEIRSWLR